MDSRGRTVTVVASATSPNAALAGYHVLRQGQRLDHLAYKYLDDGTAFWRICEQNDAMFAEQLTEQAEIAIPVDD
nr:hypothetical protein [Kofleriaceae bacterium]